MSILKIGNQLFMQICLGGIVDLVSDHCNKVSIIIRASHNIFAGRISCLQFAKDANWCLWSTIKQSTIKVGMPVKC